MPIVQVADGAFFVPSYSTQVITPAYDEAATLQGLSGGVEPEQVADAQQPVPEDYSRFDRA